MKQIEIEYPFTKNSITDQPVVLALGFFDGVHIGHQRLIKTARKVADEKKLPLMVMTFDLHPKVVYAHDANFHYLTTLEEKAHLMAELGVDYLTVFKFNDSLANLNPQQFVDDVIVGLRANTVVAGFDYTYGPRDIANMANLPNFAKGRFEIVKLPEQLFDGKKIGSTSIRKALSSGDITEATKLLGYNYSISGKVVSGMQRGRTIGFRTANLEVPQHKLIPGIGVYATKLLVNGQWYDAMTSIGYNVTFNDTKRIFIETNIFDFTEDIYGKQITVSWYKYLRGEVKFNGLEELKSQLIQDKIATRDYFKNL